MTRRSRLGLNQEKYTLTDYAECELYRDVIENKPPIAMPDEYIRAVMSIAFLFFLFPDCALEFLDCGSVSVDIVLEAVDCALDLIGCRLKHFDWVFKLIIM